MKNGDSDKERNLLPKGCKALRSRTPQVVLEDYFSTDLFEILEKVIAVYFFHINKPQWLAIFKKRFNFDNLQHKTLEVIGEESKITRERIRQILFIITHQIKRLLEGKNIIKPNIMFKNGKKIINSFKKELAPFKYITQNRLNKIIEKFSKNLISEPHINFLMHIFGYHIRYYKKIKYYNNSAYITNSIKQFSIFLSKQALFISDSEIKSQLKIDQAELEFYLEFIPESKLEIKKNTTGFLYRLHLKKVYSFSMGIYRILHEAGKPLHLSEINKILNRAKNTVLPIYKNEKNIIKIGSSGYWGLKEWQINADSIPTLLEKCLKKENKPLTLNFLFNHVNQIRPVKAHTVSAILNMKTYRKKFVQYHNNTFGLKQWPWKIPLKIKHDILKEKEKENLIIKKALEILIKKKRIFLIDLVKEIQKDGFFYIYIYRIIQKNPQIFKVERIKKKRKKFIQLKNITTTHVL